jgi:hypothetical protein
VFQGHGIPAGLIEDAQGGLHSEPGGQGGVEMRDEYRAYVADDPFVEDGDQEVAPGLRFDRAGADQRAIVSFGVKALDDRDQLDVAEPLRVRLSAAPRQWSFLSACTAIICSRSGWMTSAVRIVTIS